MAKKQKNLGGGSRMSQARMIQQMIMGMIIDFGLKPEDVAAALGTPHAADIQRAARHQPGLRRKPEPTPDAQCKSLRLKVQMKGVVKPPMWREVVVPADFNFKQLHFVIQTITGLDDVHMWMFLPRAYDSDFEIGPPAADLPSRVVKYSAANTGLTAFLAQKGDKLEYIYDFGDDWIFTVTVLEVLDSLHVACTECTKYSSDLQAIDDCGGIPVYRELRDTFAHLDTLTQEQKNEIAEHFWCDTLEEFISDNTFDRSKVNSRLADIFSQPRRNLND